MTILMSAAVNRDAFPSSEAIWIQLYDVVHPKCLHDSEQLYRDRGANCRLSSSLPLKTV